MTDYQILTDHDVKEYLTMDLAIAKMEDAFLEMANGTLVAPPRFSIAAPEGSLVFTAGAATGKERVIGFRVYDTLRRSGVDPSQIVAVYDYDQGQLKGLVIGRFLGATRTGAIGGVAVNHLAMANAQTLAIVGAGFQARTQVAAAVAVRSFETVAVYSRTRGRAATFSAEITRKHGLDSRVCSSAREAVSDADVVICATTSSTPVLETAWLKPGAHINSVGPKFAGAHEMPLDIIDVSQVIATDSLAQATGYPQPFFIEDLDLVTGLDQIVAGRQPGRRSDRDITLFCSVGLAGTEVVLANKLFQLKTNNSAS